MNEQTWITLAAGIIPSIIALAGYWFSRHKSSAEAHKVEADAAETIERTAANLVTKLNSRIECLENEVAEMHRIQTERRIELDTMRKEIAALQNKLARANQRIELLESENSRLHQQLRAARGEQ